MAPIKTGSDSAKRLPDLESAVSKYVETRTRMSDPFLAVEQCSQHIKSQPNKSLSHVKLLRRKRD